MEELPVIAWLNEVATVVHSDRKSTNNTSRRFGQKIAELCTYQCQAGGA